MNNLSCCILFPFCVQHINLCFERNYSSIQEYNAPFGCKFKVLRTTITYFKNEFYNDRNMMQNISPL
jgi:hypothetical protein